MTEAINCKTGIVFYSDGSASSTINAVIREINASGGGEVYVKGYGVHHPYNITNALVIPDSGHLKFVGEGPEWTVLQVPPNFDNNLFEFTGIKFANSYFNEFSDFEGIGNKGVGAYYNSGFVLNGTNFGVTDSTWNNVFLRDFKQDDFSVGQKNAWNNKIVGCTFEHAGRAGLYVTGSFASPDLRVTDSKFLYNDGFGISDDGDLGTYIGNWIYLNKEDGARLTHADKNVWIGNRFDANGLVENNTYFDLQVSGNLNLIEGNQFDGPNNAKYSIYASGQENEISGNTFANGSTGVGRIFIQAALKSSFVHDNPGYNPVGKVFEPFYSKLNLIVETDGDSNSPKNLTEYTLESAPATITSTGGKDVSITIEDPSGNVLSSGLPTLSDQHVPAGFKIKWQYALPPKVDVAFE
ncbi:MAG: right-handed parallel beta-helix repeat-containing protein [Nitrososphaera sp.]